MGRWKEIIFHLNIIGEQITKTPGHPEHPKLFLQFNISLTSVQLQ